jgi:hypothetical protein
MRMGVGLRGLAVRRPARVADADGPAKRRRGKFRLQVLELALGAPPLQAAILQRRDARGIVAAIFKPLQRIDNRARDRPGPENPDNPTHPKSPVRNRFQLRQALGQRPPPSQVLSRNVRGVPPTIVKVTNELKLVKNCNK